MKDWKAYSAQLKLPKLSRKQWFILGGVFGGVLFLLLILAIFIPQTIAYAYDKDRSCATSPRLFPGLSSTTATRGETFRLHRPVGLSVGKIVLYSHTICAQHRAAPESKKSYVHQERLFGLAFLSRRVSVQTSEYAAATNLAAEKRMLAPDGVLALDLNKPDKTFSYSAVLGLRAAPCKSDKQKLTCELAPLELVYAQLQEVTIVRTYAGKRLSTLATIPVQTLTPITITGSSIPPGSIAQDKPPHIILSTDKPIQELGAVQLVAKPGGQETVIPTTTSFADKRITVKIGQELARKVPFELRIASVKATDGSGLATRPAALPFSTSGGPKVKGASIGTHNVPLTPTITLTFDQALLPAQPIAKNISLTVNGAPMHAAVSISNDKVTIRPASALPLCASFTITVDAAVQNQFGVTGDSAWSIKSRAICYTTFSIGSSVRGRAITAYQFGSGPEMIVYLGAMHGDEVNSKNIMNEWFSELNAHPERIPAHRSIVVIPVVNPDGVAAGTRFNARDIDLNRNFPANDWKSIVTTPDSSQPTAAGGPYPLSEPESQAVATFIRQHSPRLVMSFHSQAAVVEANEAADSVSIASSYAARARYRAVPKSQSAPIFQYDTTGAMEDWMRDKLGRAAIVVELASGTSSEFSRNRDALWYTVGL